MSLKLDNVIMVCLERKEVMAVYISNSVYFDRLKR